MENCVLRKWKERKNSNLQDIVHENDVPLLWRQVDMVAVLALGQYSFVHLGEVEHCESSVVPKNTTQGPDKGLNQGSAVTMQGVIRNTARRFVLQTNRRSASAW